MKMRGYLIYDRRADQEKGEKRQKLDAVYPSNFPFHPSTTFFHTNKDKDKKRGRKNSTNMHPLQKKATILLCSSDPPSGGSISFEFLHHHHLIITRDTTTTPAIVIIKKDSVLVLHLF